MKKFLLILASVMTLVLTSCGTESKVANGWFTDYEACLKQAQKDNKKVLLLVSRDEADNVSANLKQNVFYTEEFYAAYSENFTFCEIDVSPSLFKAANPGKDADAKAKREAGKYKKILDSRMRVVTIYGVQNTPVMYVLSKEGYVMQILPYLPCTNTEEFGQILDSYKGEIDAYQTLVDDVNKASGIERVKAIDTLYENTNAGFRYMLTAEMKKVEKLDKKNTTGLVGKYVMAIATSDAMDAYLNRKPDTVASIYEKAAKHPALSDDQRQQSWYAAAYVIGSNTPTPEVTVKIIDYLEKAIGINPDSEIGKHCAGLLAQVKEFQIRQKEMENKVKEEEAEAEKE